MKVANRLDQLLMPLGEMGWDVDRLMEQWLGDRRNTQQGFVPRTDIIESAKQYELMMELPGVAHEDVNVEALDGRLVISGEKRLMQQEGHAMVRGERAHGPFKRSFEFADQVDYNQIEATFRDGVLHLTVPKSEKVLPRKIQIKTSEPSKTSKK